MKKLLYDLSEFADILTPEAEALKLAERFAKRRKEKKLTQRKAAQLACVSYSSLRRFENTGEISLRSLLRIAYAIGYIPQKRVCDSRRYGEDKGGLRAI